MRKLFKSSRIGWENVETKIKPFPEECAHPECAKTPIVGVNKRFVCEDHLKWVLKPIREIVRLVADNTRG